jgi:hypothetical protein
MTAHVDDTGWSGDRPLFDMVPVGPAPLIGDVLAFDDEAGMGVVAWGPGRRLDFHCTAITDGSRSIAVGTVVAFVITPGHLGRLEARTVRPLPGVLPPGSTLEPGAAGYAPEASGPSSGEGGGTGGGPIPGAPVSDRLTPPSGTPPV